MKSILHLRRSPRFSYQIYPSGGPGSRATRHSGTEDMTYLVCCDSPYSLVLKGRVHAGWVTSGSDAAPRCEDATRDPRSLRRALSGVPVVHPPGRLFAQD